MNQTFYFRFLSILFCSICMCNIFAHIGIEETSETLQYPTYSPLWAIGHRNIRKNHVLVANRFIDTHYENGSADFSLVTLRYGVTDRLTTFFSLPVVYNNTVNNKKDSGLGDFIANAEYIFFDRRSMSARSRGTFLVEFAFPTATKVASNLPLLDTKSYRFLLGTTGEYGTMYSYFYYSLGTQLYTKHEDIKPGTDFIYEWGFAPVLYHEADHDLMFFVDWNGRYTSSDTKNGIIQPKTGGNILFMGTALEYRYKNILMYLSVQAPITQSLSTSIHYRTSFYINATF